MLGWRSCQRWCPSLDRQRRHVERRTARGHDRPPAHVNNSQPPARLRALRRAVATLRSMCGSINLLIARHYARASRGSGISTHARMSGARKTRWRTAPILCVQLICVYKSDARFAGRGVPLAEGWDQFHCFQISTTCSWFFRADALIAASVLQLLRGGKNDRKDFRSNIAYVCLGRL